MSARDRLIDILFTEYNVNEEEAQLIAKTVLRQHAHELSEKIRTHEDITYGEVTSGMEHAADLIDPEVNK